jgi:hypothetical protein
MNLEIPNKTGKKLFDWLVDNKKTLISQKKFEIKKADACYFNVEFLSDRADVAKAANGTISADATKIKVRLVINTTKLFDSHSDVHIDGLWGKSLSETVLLYLLQEHSMTFKGIISDEVQASVKTMSWKSLGASYEGNTQALVFDVIIDKNRNEYMFEQYQKGYVKNHSVGMRYVKIYMCINDDNYSSEYDNWNKYYPLVANKEAVDEQDYFFAVTEAKVVEGSAVPKGSNFITPTLTIEEEKQEPVNSTHHTTQPLKDTRIMDALNKLKNQI